MRSIKEGESVVGLVKSFSAQEIHHVYYAAGIHPKKRGEVPRRGKGVMGAIFSKGKGGSKKPQASSLYRRGALEERREGDLLHPHHDRRKKGGRSLVSPRTYQKEKKKRNRKEEEKKESPSLKQEGGGGSTRRGGKSLPRGRRRKKTRNGENHRRPSRYQWRRGSDREEKEKVVNFDGGRKREGKRGRKRPSDY